METATVEPGNDPMHEQNQREDPQRERRLLAARPHAFAQEVRIERRERNDHDDGEDCEIRPKARDGDRASCCEQCGGRGDHEQACLEVSRDWHPTISEEAKVCRGRFPRILSTLPYVIRRSSPIYAPATASLQCKISTRR